jgi:acyl carrier protein
MALGPPFLPVPRRKIRDVNTLERLRRLLAEVLGISEGSVTPDTLVIDLFARSGADSLDRAELVIALEEEFVSFEVPDEAADRWDELTQTGTVQQLADLIDQTSGH